MPGHSIERKMRKGFTWAEWSIVIALVLIIISITTAAIVAYWADMKLKIANGRVSEAEKLLANVNQELAAVKLQYENAIHELGEVPLPDSVENHELVEQIINLKSQMDFLSEENKSLKTQYNVAESTIKKLNGHVNELNAFIDKHEDSRWMTLKGRPQREP